MAWNPFRREQSTRAYPAAGTNVTGDVGRFRRAKTTGARRAQEEADKWERKDRENERLRRGRYR
jgi:hypothetical protein